MGRHFVEKVLNLLIKTSVALRIDTFVIHLPRYVVNKYKGRTVSVA